MARNDDDVLAILMFGSRARGEPFRDTDICLVTRDGSGGKKRLQYLAVFPSSFDIHVFDELPLYIKKRVMKEGKFLLNKDFSLVFQKYYATIKDLRLFEPHFDAYLGMVADG
ncbi:MAG: nucleotidyltransferase domain-containing protein [Candidatus Lokiarchaeota archaeon]|nr:nucleotidyltransferase domain-containing protein [Candidatus Lokiarchaeota archaeon]